MDTRPIGMFDSGVGGITLLKEFIKECPNENILYLGDTKRFPYGSKSKEELVDCTKNGINFLIRQGVKAAIIACGTSTSQALEEVRQTCQIPVFGIIDETIEYIRDKGYKKIGVIATAGTIRSKEWQNRLLSSIPDAEITAQACPLLAPMAEEGWTDNEVARLTIREYLKAFHRIDCLILGCTHYPLFVRFIREEIGNTEIINTGTVLSRKMKEMLAREQLNQEPNVKGQVRIYLTRQEESFVEVSGRILQDEEINTKIQVVDV